MNIEPSTWAVRVFLKTMPTANGEDLFRVVSSAQSFRFECHRNMMVVMRFRSFRLHSSASHRSPWTRFALGASRLPQRAAEIAKFPAQVMDSFSLLWWALGTAEKEERSFISLERMCCTSLNFLHSTPVPLAETEALQPWQGSSAMLSSTWLVCVLYYQADLRGRGKR